MHAIRQYEFGPPDVLCYEAVPDPVPGEGQVRIAVEAAGVHVIGVPALGARFAQVRELETAALAKAASGAWRPITQPYPLRRAAYAHQAIENRATTGKVVLVPERA